MPAGDVRGRRRERPDVAVALAETVGVDAVVVAGSYSYVSFVHRTTSLAVHCTNVKRRQPTRRSGRAPSPGARRPRHTREQIAAAALAIADAEGFEAVSMRRVATELGAGTMTLYHYVRTKDELHRPDGRRDHGRGAGSRGRASRRLARGARRRSRTRSRDAFVRHPWALERIAGRRAAARTACATSSRRSRRSPSLDLDSPTSSSSIALVDDYVFGYVLRADLEATQTPGDEEFDELVLPFYEAQLETGDYPNISKLFAGLDAASGFDLVVGVFRAEGRFERGLERLLDGLEASLPRSVIRDAAEPG